MRLRQMIRVGRGTSHYIGSFIVVAIFSRTKLNPAPLGGWGQQFGLMPNLTGMICIEDKHVAADCQDNQAMLYESNGCRRCEITECRYQSRLQPDLVARPTSAKS
jgi:hypothetical protein